MKHIWNWKRLLATGVVTLVMCAPLHAGVAKERASPAAATVAFLGVVFENDNEALEPTSAAERARIGKIETLFKSKLEEEGEYAFVPVDDATNAEIAAGQEIGACNGCEVEFGRKLGAGQIAWIKVQKISNLILNMNVYMADVAKERMTFVHSVDIRGNTDESWTRSLTYLLKNYLLVDQRGATATN